MRIEAALARGRRIISISHRYAEATGASRQGLELARVSPDGRATDAALDGELELGRAVGTGLPSSTAWPRPSASGTAWRRPPADEAQSLIRLGRAIWQTRDASYVRPSGATETESRSGPGPTCSISRRLGRPPRAARTGGRGRGRRRRRPSASSTEAEGLLGPSPALDRDRRSYAGALGLDNLPSGRRRSLGSAWEHYDLGRSYLRSGQLEAGRRSNSARALDLRPQDFWLNFYEGLCDYRLGRFAGAVNAFRVCIALSPETAECYYNRALAHQALGRLDRALADYSRALALNPNLTDAALNRGILHYRQGRHADAIADLEQALARPPTRRPWE